MSDKFDVSLTTNENILKFNVLPFKPNLTGLHLPKHVDLYIEAHNCRPQFVNSFIQCEKTEASALALHTEYEQNLIDTNERAIIVQEVAMRISFLRVNQNIDRDSEFSLDFRCDAPDEGSDVAIVRAKHIRGYKAGLWAPDFRICTLHPGNYIKIAKITVIEGNGYEHAKYIQASHDIFDHLDFPTIFYITSKGQITSGKVAMEDLVKVAAKFGNPLPPAILKNSGVDPSGLASKSTYRIKDLMKPTVRDMKILFIAHESYTGQSSESDMRGVSEYHIIRNPEKAELAKSTGDAPVLINYQDKYLPIRMSAHSSPQHFILKFRFFGSITPREFLRKLCNTIIGKLRKISEGMSLAIKDTQTGSNSPPIWTWENMKIMRMVDGAFSVEILGEGHMIGELLRRHIYDQDPTLGLVHYNPGAEHSAIIIIRHTAPEKLMIDAIATLIKMYQTVIDRTDEI